MPDTTQEAVAAQEKPLAGREPTANAVDSACYESLQQITNQTAFLNKVLNPDDTNVGDDDINVPDVPEEKVPLHAMSCCAIVALEAAVLLSILESLPRRLKESRHSMCQKVLKVMVDASGEFEFTGDEDLNHPRIVSAMKLCTSFVEALFVVFHENTANSKRKEVIEEFAEAWA
jgi:hypothetical protein